MQMVAFIFLTYKWGNIKSQFANRVLVTRYAESRCPSELHLICRSCFQ